jgi:hypothetical protein
MWRMTNVGAATFVAVAVIAVAERPYGGFGGSQCTVTYGLEYVSDGSGLLTPTR